jgi:tRNA (mo5U34)-methyltransferase
VESAILDDYSPYNGGFGRGYPGGQMVMEFYPGDQYAGNATNWWVPTLACLEAMVASSGFDRVASWKLVPVPREMPLLRGFVRGRKVSGTASA